MEISKKIIYSILLLTILMFIGAYDRIQWFETNKNFLTNIDNIPADINISASKLIADNENGYDIFIHGIGKGVIPIAVIVSPLIIGYLFSGNFAYHLNSGFGNCIITRRGFNNYFFKITFTNFLKSFLTLFLAELTFLLLCLLIFGHSLPNINYSQVEDSLSNIYYQFPFIYCLIHIVKQSIYMALLSIIGMCFVIFTRNKFIISLSSFIIYLLINIICPILDMAINMPFLKLIYPDYIIMSFMTGDTLLNSLIGYAIYTILAGIFLISTYKKYNKNYIR